MAINFPNDPATNPGNGGEWTDPGGSGTWAVEIINGEAIWTLVSNDAGGGGGGGGANALNELSDVTLSNPGDGQFIAYNQSTAQWINVPAPAAQNVNLNDLGDVDTTGGTDGDVLVKQANGNWEAQTPANNGGIGEAPEDGTPYVRQDASWISMPSDPGGGTLNIDEAPADGVAYTRKDNSWVPGVEAVSGSTAQIEGDNNIDTGTNTRAVTTGHVLTYDGSKFAPAAPTGGGSDAPSITWNIGATGTASYDFTGPGFSTSTANPALTLVRGQTYVFNNTSGAHPFRIQSTVGTSGTPYSTGVTNNNTIGEVTFVVPMDAPADLFYQCSAHAGMFGTIAVLENSTGGDSGPTTTDDLAEGSTNKYFPEAPNDGKQYARQSEGWSEVTASDGGGGVEEAPEDGLLYARSNGGWSSLSAGISLSYGKASTSNKGLAASDIGGYEDTASAEADGFTLVTLTEPDDSANAVQLPASFNDTTWFDVQDPETVGNGYQTIHVSGNGWAAFMDAAAVSGELYPTFESGYDPVNSNMEEVDLLFGFHNADMVLDMVATKEVGQYFVIHIQWKDDYGALFVDAGEGASEGVYPYPAYDPDANPGGDPARKKVKGDTRAPQFVLVVAELWLGMDGSVRVVYGKNPTAVGVKEDSKVEGYSQQTNGIYKAGTPVTEVMGAAIEFSQFAEDPLIYGLETTADGTVNTDKVFDWFIAYELPTVPFLTDAPSDGTVYGRQDGAWVEAAAGGGGGGAGDASGYIQSHIEPGGRKTTIDFLQTYPFNQVRDSYPLADQFGDATIVRPSSLSAALFAYASSGVGTWKIEDDGAEKVLKLHVEDMNGNTALQFYNSSSPASALDSTAAYLYSFDGSIDNPFNPNLNPNLFLFCTVRFWRNTPEAAEPWQYISVDTWLPIKYNVTPTSASGYQVLVLDQQYLGAGEYDCQTVLDYIGATQEELDGTHLTGLGSLPDLVNASGYPTGAVIECYTNPDDQSLSEPGGGGDGPPARSAEGQDSRISPGGPGEGRFPNATQVGTASGMVLTIREDVLLDYNVGNDNGGVDEGGGGGDFPARKALTPEEKETRAAERKAAALSSIKSIDSVVTGKRNASGLGWRIPGFDSVADDPRWIQDYTLDNRAGRASGDMNAGTLQYDRLGVWDLYGFDSFLRSYVPNQNETISWDAGISMWTTSGNIFFRKYGQKAKDNPHYGKVMDLIEAVQSDPELKAALKAALAD